MSIKMLNQTVKSDKDKKEVKKTPVSEMGLAEVSEFKSNQESRLLENQEAVREVLRVIRPQLTLEETEALIYGVFFEGEEAIITKAGNKDQLEGKTFKYGLNAVRGLIGYERLAELRIGANKEEIQGKAVVLPVENWEVQTELEALGQKLYWELYSGLQIAKADKRIKQLEEKPKEEITSLEDFLENTDTSDKEVLKK